MEQRESVFENIPQLDDDTRREVYEDLRQKLITSLEKYPFVQEMFALPGTNNLIIDSRNIATTDSAYKITRNTHTDSIEISVDKLGRRDNPNIILESIRFKTPRIGITDFPPMLEYHRTLKKGGSRTLQNNIPALRRIEGFISHMEKDLKQAKSK